MRELLRELREIDHRAAAWLAVLSGLTCGAVLFSALYPVEFPGIDFTAFWCGGAVLLEHASPYLNQPLHACEAAHFPAFFIAYPNVTIPVPLPPYALVLMAPLSLVPFAAARVIWWIALTLAAFAAGRGIAHLTGMPPGASLAVSFFAVLGPAIFPGALAPIPVALTIYAAFALRRRQWTRATILLACAMIEPHMVLPACAAVFCFVPQMRARLLAAALLLAGITLAAVGPAGALSYFSLTLPVHALSEVNNLSQYSLSAVLYHLGVAPGLAVRLGSLQYIAFAGAGIVIAGRLAHRYGDRSWLVLATSAFAVAGGVFIHLDQVAIVIPLACLVLPARSSPLARTALVMLALPAEIVINWIPFALPAALSCGLLVAYYRAHWAAVIASSVAVVVAACVILALLIQGNRMLAWPVRAQASNAVPIAAPVLNASASLPWGQFTSLAVFRPWIWWPEKTLTFLPVIVLLALTARQAYGRGPAGCFTSGETAELTAI